MGRFLRQYDKEYMKMAMLKQEETFRQQVNELHRLYRVQKLLMRDAAQLDHVHQSPRDHHRRRNPPPMPDLELPPADDQEDPADVELTLATGWRGAARRKNKADSSDSASGASFSSSASTESGSGGESLDVRDWGLWYSGPVVVEPQRPVAVPVRQGRADQRPAWQLHYLIQSQYDVTHPG